MRSRLAARNGLALLGVLGALAAPADEPTLREPSGLASTCRRTPEGKPLMLVVDDELPSPLLATVERTTLQPWVWLPPEPFEGADDLETLAAAPGDGCDGWWYLAATSHRRFGNRRETRAVRFRLGSGEAGGIRLLDAVAFSLEDGILAYLRREEVLPVRTDDDAPTRPWIDGRPWWRRNPDAPRQPYALEIEASAVVGDAWWVGLKFPLRDGRALLLRYDLETVLHGDEAPCPQAHLWLDLEGYGLSGATGLDGDLLVAASPTTKRPPGGRTAPSRLHRFRLEDGSPRAAGRIELQRDQAKAEGLAVSGDRLWIAYDGIRGGFDWRPLDRAGDAADPRR